MEDNEEFQVVFSRVILTSGFEIDLNTLRDQDVTLEVDASYTIGRSVAVLWEGQVIGHLMRQITRPAWIRLQFGYKVQGKIYDCIGGFKNSVRFSTLSKARELGIEMRFYFCDTNDGVRQITGASDAKLFLQLSY